MLSTEQERDAAAATVERLTSSGLPYGDAAAVARKVLGDVLVDLGFCDRETVESTVREARATGRPMGQLLLERYHLNSRQLAIALAERCGMEFLSLDDSAPDSAALRLVPADVARRVDAAPVAFGDDGTVLIAMTDPSNRSALPELTLHVDRPLRPVVVTREDLDDLLIRIEGGAARAPDPPRLQTHVTADLTIAVDRGPIAELAHAIVAEAIAQGALPRPQPHDGAFVVSCRIELRMTAEQSDESPASAGLS
jgi:type IV pilus assembly protein PilB